MEQIVLLGGGGHCKSILDSILASGKFEVYGIIDNQPKFKSMFGIPFIGGDEFLPDLISKGIINIFITVGSVGNTQIRRKIYKKCRNLGFNFPNIIDKTATVSRNSKISQGVFIGKNVVINSDVIISDFAIINSGAIIDHECSVGEFSHISPGATLCGNVKIGSDTHIGANATVIQGITVADHTLVGAGCVIIKDIHKSGVYVGNPAQFIK